MTVLIFPTLKGLVFPVKRSPNWSTDIQQAISGKQDRFGRFSYPLYKLQVGYSVLRSDNVNLEWQDLTIFYNLCAGGAGLFQFADPDDGTATAQAFGVGDGTSTAFQLTRAMTGSAHSFVEPIFAPSGSPSISVGGVVQNPATYSISALGVVTFNSAPANGAPLSWTGTYNWWCRFDDDSADFEKFAYQFWRLGKISFTTEKF